ncbi:hypothetical protein BegalDRAFT_1192 [Beggiatoa alba B18LD]|uniref:DUF7639 domain-containing protein n=1 Tax=Beggiatoa alba B18LD TaxID=395493 RepID=I3CEQ1_9GAMM|nr:hypothetical protein [Beggiatoa alba]EIJ42094.1 hypothetical protein BegalDRAFT_1192 [Beggiatoa alba B18LD]
MQVLQLLKTKWQVWKEKNIEFPAVQRIRNFNWFYGVLNDGGEARTGAFCIVYEKPSPQEHYVPSPVWVFADGTIWMQLQSGVIIRHLKTLRTYIQHNEIVSFVPLTPDVTSAQEEADLFLEISDIMSQLNGGKSAYDKCEEAVQSYVTHPSQENLAILRMAYSSIPSYLRKFLVTDKEQGNVKRLLNINESRGDSSPLKTILECQ